MPFSSCEIKDGGFLVGATGNGQTPSEAITDYVKNISGRKLVFGAYTRDRVEIDATYPRMTALYLLYDIAEKTGERG
jgi:hypothetical protein